jgi:hypothetical protein
MNFRRFKNHIRNRLNGKKKIIVLDKGDASSVLCIHFLINLFPKKMVVSTKNYKDGVVMPITMEEEAILFMNHFLKKQKFKSEGIRPMSSIPLNEAEAICDHLKKSYKKSRPEDILNSIEKFRPGVCFSIKKTSKVVSDLL